jgi:hypothetical protein
MIRMASATWEVLLLSACTFKIGEEGLLGAHWAFSSRRGHSIHDLVVEFATKVGVPPCPVFPDEAPAVREGSEMCDFGCLFIVLFLGV